VAPRIRYEDRVMRVNVAEYLRLQGRMCGQLGSSLYDVLLGHAADDAAAGGPVATVLDGYPHEPVYSALALRLMGSVHRLVLDGEAPALAAHYPSVGGDGDAERAWPAFRAVVASNEERLRSRIVNEGVQTNEVRRTAALVCGFLEVARATGHPLRCLEIGASGGLNLRWDRFRYEAATGVWGDAASPVVLRDSWVEGRPPIDVAARVAERAGCDRSPVDPTTEAGRKTLLSFVWPDQLERLQVLAAACDVAARVPATVERANGADWLGVRLATPRAGMATVVYHSIVIQYFDQESRDRMQATLEAAGARATAAAPLAWLRMEPGGEQAEVRLTTWPGGDERLVATTGFHGRDVRVVAAA
jgi:hypothetical protein